MEFFDSLDTLLRIYWYVAIPVSVIFIIQTILTFIGGEASFDIATNMEAGFEADGGAFQVFSLRNLVSFLLGFSWTGISFYETLENKTILILLSIAVGSLFIYAFFIVIRQIQKLAEDNSFNVNDTINKLADVYLTIPEKQSGKGKVLISIKGSMHELDAMSKNESIPTGKVVRVVSVESGNVLIVENL